MATGGKILPTAIGWKKGSWLAASQLLGWTTPPPLSGGRDALRINALTLILGAIYAASMLMQARKLLLAMDGPTTRIIRETFPCKA